MAARAFKGIVEPGQDEAGADAGVGRYDGVDRATPETPVSAFWATSRNYFTRNSVIRVWMIILCFARDPDRCERISYGFVSLTLMKIASGRFQSRPGTVAGSNR